MYLSPWVLFTLLTLSGIWFLWSQWQKPLPPTGPYYYFVSLYIFDVEHDRTSLKFFSFWWERPTAGIPTEQDIYWEIVQRQNSMESLPALDFKVISITQWTQNDYIKYQTYRLSNLVEPPVMEPSELDYPALIQEAVDKEDYETAALLQKEWIEQQKREK